MEQIAMSLSLFSFNTLAAAEFELNVIEAH